MCFLFFFNMPHKRILASVFIPLLSTALLCTTGFCLWSFLDESFVEEQAGGEVFLEALSEVGQVDILPPEDLNYESYRIIFEQGSVDMINDVTTGISLIPKLTFDFSNYRSDEGTEKPAEYDGYDFYFYVTIETSNSALASGGFGYYVTTAEAQSYETRKKLDIDWTQDSTRTSFAPVFYYNEGRKPVNSAEYGKMISQVYNDNDPIKMTVHVTFEPTLKRVNNE